jgi:Na+-transporting NADH:ubiquinone oxidoreductase subunit NqrC
MREGGTLKVVLILGLVSSMIVNAVVLWDNQGLRLSKGELDRSYQDLTASFDELNVSFDELKASFDDLNQTNWEMEIRYSDLEASFLGLFDDPFSPPVPKL